MARAPYGRELQDRAGGEEKAERLTPFWMLDAAGKYPEKTRA